MSFFSYAEHYIHVIMLLFTVQAEPPFLLFFLEGSARRVVAIMSLF